MTSNHYRWQQAWTCLLDGAASDGATLQHADGLLVRVALQDSTPVGMHCRSVHAAGRAWRLSITNPDRILAPRPDMRDPASRTARLRRLTDEAAAIWRHAVEPHGRYPSLKTDR